MQLIIQFGQLLEHLQAQPDIGVERGFDIFAVGDLQGQVLEVTSGLTQLVADVVVANAHAQRVLQRLQGLGDQLANLTQHWLVFNQRVALGRRPVGIDHQRQRRQQIPVQRLQPV